MQPFFHPSDKGADGAATVDAVRRPRRPPAWLAWLGAHWGTGLWGLLVVVLAVLAVARPERPVTRFYWDAALDWWAGEPCCAAGRSGLPYVPSNAVLFGPFTWLPLPVADQLWRLLSVAVATWAVVRAARLMRPDDPARVAGLALALAVPAAAIDILRGHWDLMMSAVLLHAVVDIAWGRPWRGGLLLALAAALKPLALVPALLFAATRPRLAPALLLGLGVVLAVPFLHPDPGFVAEQYRALAGMLGRAAAPAGGTWFDLAAFLHHWGLGPDAAVLDGVRLAAVAAVPAAALAAARRLDAGTAALVTLALATATLVLLNPRTGEGAYYAVAVLAGLCAAVEHHRRPRAALGVLLGVLALGLGTHFYGDWLYRPTRPWLKQGLTLALYPYLAWLIATRRSLVDAAPEPQPAGRWIPARVALVLCASVPPLFGLYRLVTAHSLPARLSMFEGTDFILLVVVVNVLAFAVVSAAGPVLAWMQGRPAA